MSHKPLSSPFSLTTMNWLATDNWMPGMDALMKRPSYVRLRRVTSPRRRNTKSSRRCAGSVLGKAALASLDGWSLERRMEKQLPLQRGDGTDGPWCVFWWVVGCRDTIDSYIVNFGNGALVSEMDHNWTISSHRVCFAFKLEMPLTMVLFRQTYRCYSQIH